MLTFTEAQVLAWITPISARMFVVGLFAVTACPPFGPFFSELGLVRSSIATGHGWLDSEPEIREIQPDIYAVNEDGDRREKRDYCLTHGIDYRVLARVPKAGLLQRQSTALRGF